MELTQQIEADIATAMKARDEVRLQVLRLLKAALKNYSIEIKGELTPQQMLQILQKEAKKRQESIELYGQAGRNDLVTKETKELEVLSEYLPEQASEEAIRTKIKEIISQKKLSGHSAMGVVIQATKDAFQGAADGSVIAKIAREELV